LIEDGLENGGWLSWNVEQDRGLEVVLMID
jgi:hypothetical protein